MDGRETSSVARRRLARAAQLAREAWRVSRPALVRAWGLARPQFVRVLEFLLALLIVFEEWGWRPLAELLGWLARWRLWALVEAWVVRLPPYLALLTFVLPSALLIPLKFLALLLIADRHVLLAGLLFLLAPVV